MHLTKTAARVRQRDSYYILMQDNYPEEHEIVVLLKMQLFLWPHGEGAKYKMGKKDMKQVIAMGLPENDLKCKKAKQ